MTIQFQPAKRENVPLLLGLAGASGSGKTYSALRLASGLAGEARFCVIDTEAGRALHYADQFAFDEGRLEAPFRPGAYAEAIAAADTAGYPVIVIDSASHEHAGDGGLLDWQEEELQRMAGDDTRRREAMKMAAWIKPKLAHKAMVSRLLQVRAHVILCFRAEEKIEIAKENGKTVVRAKRSLTGLDGWVPVSEKNLPYELTVSVLLTGDQPGVPRPIKLPQALRPFIALDEPISEATGVALGRWAAGESTPGGDSDTEREADALASRLLTLAGELGRRDDVASAIARHRRSAGADLASHVAWLSVQLERAQAIAAERATEDVAW